MSEKRRRSRLSIRTKLLALVAGSLLITMAAYLVLAVQLIVEDRLAYAYDLNRAVARTFSEQVRATLESGNERLLLYGQLAESASSEAGYKQLGEELLRADDDILRLSLYLRGADGKLSLDHELSAPERMAPLEIGVHDLDQLDAQNPLPLAAAGSEMLVRNRSIPPSAQLLTLMVGRGDAPGSAPFWVVVADMKQDPLARIFAGLSGHASYLVDAEGRVVAHRDPAQVVARADASRVPTVEAALAASEARSGVREYVDSSGKSMLGAWSRVDLGRLAVISEVERDAALVAVTRLVRLSVLFGVGIVLAAFVASVFFARLLTTPLMRLRAAVAALAGGDRNVKLEISARDEIGDLAADFDHMAHAIRDAEARLIQSERLAAFGQLGAGITHEVKNPLGALRSFAQLALANPGNPEDTRESLEVIEREAGRCLDIVQGLLTFARKDVAGKRHPLSSNSLVQQGVKLVAHQLMIGNVRLHAEYGEDATVSVNPGQIHQVILNLALNAQQAMAPNGGNLYVSTGVRDEQTVEVSFRDDGPGIPPDIIGKVFEPFFTTKEAGQGTGMGLSVSYGIIAEHGGELRVESEQGQGATFRIRLPRVPDESRP